MIYVQNSVFMHYIRKTLRSNKLKKYAGLHQHLTGLVSGNTAISRYVWKILSCSISRWTWNWSTSTKRGRTLASSTTSQKCESTICCSFILDCDRLGILTITYAVVCQYDVTPNKHERGPEKRRGNRRLTREERWVKRRETGRDKASEKEDKQTQIKRRKTWHPGQHFLNHQWAEAELAPEVRHHTNDRAKFGVLLFGSGQTWNPPSPGHQKTSKSWAIESVRCATESQQNSWSKGLEVRGMRLKVFKVIHRQHRILWTVGMKSTSIRFKVSVLTNVLLHRHHPLAELLNQQSVIHHKLEVTQSCSCKESMLCLRQPQNWLQLRVRRQRGHISDDFCTHWKYRGCSDSPWLWSTKYERSRGDDHWHIASTNRIQKLENELQKRSLSIFTISQSRYALGWYWRVFYISI